MTNPAISIKQRLLNLSRSEAVDYQQLLERFAMGRLLWRLVHSGRTFVLKGAQLFSVWQAMPHRPTRDLDLLGFGNASVEEIRGFFGQLLAAAADPEDGLVWTQLTASRIREDQKYEGVRVEVVALLDRTRIPLQIDIGFGDSVVPPPVERSWRELLGFPESRLLTYPPETVIAEKLHAAVERQLDNSRMKDFFDLDWLCRNMAFDGETLREALRSTFNRRGTAWPVDTPLALTAAFGDHAGKRAQWTAFLRKNRLTADPLPIVVGRLESFLRPVLIPSVEGMGMAWEPGAGWRLPAAGAPCVPVQEEPDEAAGLGTDGRVCQ